MNGDYLKIEHVDNGFMICLNEYHVGDNTKGRGRWVANDETQLLRIVATVLPDSSKANVDLDFTVQRYEPTIEVDTEQLEDTEDREQSTHAYMSEVCDGQYVRWADYKKLLEYAFGPAKAKE